MTHLTKMDSRGFEQLLLCRDAETGLHAVLAVHDTTLGPALGAVRLRAYRDEDEAVRDAKDFAEAMTLKAAVAGLDLGGGAMVVIADPKRDKTEALLLAIGRAIATLEGRFIPVNDVGTVQQDIRVIGREASPVCDQGDPSPSTALGVREAIRACVRHTTGEGELAGLRVCVQGAGNVGGRLAELVAAEDAEVLVSDVDAELAESVAGRVGGEVVEPDAALSSRCDVLAPCALGGVVTPETVDGLACRIIAGGANNVLGSAEMAGELASRGILYAPDFCANAGGLIFLEEQLLGHDEAQAEQRVRAGGDLVAEVLRTADERGVLTVEAATELARARLADGPAHPS